MGFGQYEASDTSNRLGKKTGKIQCSLMRRNLTQNFGVAFQAVRTRAELAEGDMIRAGGEDGDLGSQDKGDLAKGNIETICPSICYISRSSRKNTLISGHTVAEYFPREEKKEMSSKSFALKYIRVHARYSGSKAAFGLLRKLVTRALKALQVSWFEDDCEPFCPGDFVRHECKYLIFALGKVKLRSACLSSLTCASGCGVLLRLPPRRWKVLALLLLSRPIKRQMSVLPSLFFEEKCILLHSKLHALKLKLAPQKIAT